VRSRAEQSLDSNCEGGEKGLTIGRAGNVKPKQVGVCKHEGRNIQDRKGEERGCTGRNTSGIHQLLFEIEERRSKRVCRLRKVNGKSRRLLRKGAVIRRRKCQG